MLMESLIDNGALGIGESYWIRWLSESSKVLSPTKNPIVIVVVDVKKIETTKKTRGSDMVAKSMMKVHATHWAYTHEPGTTAVVDKMGSAFSAVRGVGRWRMHSPVKAFPRNLRSGLPLRRIGRSRNSRLTSNQNLLMPEGWWATWE